MELFDSVNEWVESFGGWYNLILFIVGMYVLRILSNAIYGGKEGKFYKPPLDGFGCPRCLEEYQPQIETCADCGEKIMQFKEMPSSETFKKYHT